MYLGMRKETNCDHKPEGGNLGYRTRTAEGFPHPPLSLSASPHVLLHINSLSGLLGYQHLFLDAKGPEINPPTSLKVFPDPA